MARREDLVGVGRDGDAEDLAAEDRVLPALALLGFFREIVNGIDAGLDVVHDVADLVAGFDFSEDDADVGGGGGADRRRMPSTSRMASSMGTQMPRSTSAGVALG
jgi:hypothetical protein